MTLNAIAARAALPLFAPNHAFRTALLAVEPTAMRNIVAAARAAEVYEEWEIFLRYQAARGYLRDAAVTVLLEQAELRQRQQAAGADLMPWLRAFLGQVARLHRAVREVR